MSGSTAAVVAIAVLGGLLLVAGIVAGVVAALRRRKALTGREGLLGARARVLDWSGDSGHVLAEGERWSATADQPPRVGQRVTIVGLDGLTVHVAAREPDHP